MAIVNPNAPGFFKGNPGGGGGNSNTDIYVVSGAVIGENLVLTMSDSTTRTIALNSVFSYNQITGLTFNETNRLLTVNQQGRAMSVTIPGGNSNDPDENTFLSSGSFNENTNVLTLNRNDGQSINVDLQSLVDEVIADTNDYVTSGDVDGDTLTLTRNEGETVDIDVTDLNNANVDAEDIFGSQPSNDTLPYYTSSGWEYRQFPVATVNMSGTGNVSKVSYDSATNTLTIVDTEVSGGGTPVPDLNASLSINNRTHPLEGPGDTYSINASTNVTSGYTLDKISTPTVSGLSGATITNLDTDAGTFTVSGISSAALGTLTISLTATATHGSTTQTDTASATSTVYAPVYWQTSTTQPTDVSDAHSEGQFSNGKNINISADSTEDAKLYVMVPQSVGSVNFLTGAYYLDFTEVAHTFDTNWTLYTIDDYDGNSFTLTIREA